MASLAQDNPFLNLPEAVLKTICAVHTDGKATITKLRLVSQSLRRISDQGLRELEPAKCASELRHRFELRKPLQAELDKLVSRYPNLLKVPGDTQVVCCKWCAVHACLQRKDFAKLQKTGMFDDGAFFELRKCSHCRLHFCCERDCEEKSGPRGKVVTTARTRAAPAPDARQPTTPPNKEPDL